MSDHDRPDPVPAFAAFPDAGCAVSPQDATPEQAVLAAELEALRADVARLERQIADALRENGALGRQKASLERGMIRAHGEIERWRLLARDLADQLWELGQTAKTGEGLAVAEPERADGAA